MEGYTHYTFPAWGGKAGVADCVAFSGRNSCLCVCVCIHVYCILVQTSLFQSDHLLPVCKTKADEYVVVLINHSSRFIQPHWYQLKFTGRCFKSEDSPAQSPFLKQHLSTYFMYSKVIIYARKKLPLWGQKHNKAGSCSHDFIFKKPCMRAMHEKKD